MPTVADVLRRYGGQYLERFGATMPGEHKKVLHAITAGRTGELGTVLYVCQSCGEIHAIGRSCGNRHCPTCQHEKTKAWLEKQTDRHYRLFRPAYPYYWDPYGGGGYLTSQWTTTPAGIRHQLWYDPAKHIYYYYP